MRLPVIRSLTALVIGSVAATTAPNWGDVHAGKKTTPLPRSDSARNADELFWQTFRGGHYDNIQQALEVLTAEYLKTPADAVTSAHVAWLHTWRAAEASRKTSIPATITDDIILARKYFQTAVAPNSSEARYLGFSAA